MTKLKEMLIENKKLFHNPNPIIREISKDKYFEVLKDFVWNDNYPEFYEDNEIHGVSHIERVILLSFYLYINLYDKEGLNGNDLLVILYAAAYHDVGRYSNGEEVDHGRKSARIFRKLEKNIESDLIDMICIIVEAHSLNENNLYGFITKNGIHQNDKIFKLMKIIQDADMLDRTRFLIYLNIQSVVSKRIIDSDKLFFEISKLNITTAINLVEII